jgi:hypothetical protein
MVGWLVQVEFIAEDEIVQIVPNIHRPSTWSVWVHLTDSLILPPVRFFLLTRLTHHTFIFWGICLLFMAPFVRYFMHNWLLKLLRCSHLCC